MVIWGGWSEPPPFAGAMRPGAEGLEAWEASAHGRHCRLSKAEINCDTGASRNCCIFFPPAPTHPLTSPTIHPFTYPPTHPSIIHPSIDRSHRTAHLPPQQLQVPGNSGEQKHTVDPEHTQQLQAEQSGLAPLPARASCSLPIAIMPRAGPRGGCLRALLWESEDPLSRQLRTGGKK